MIQKGLALYDIYLYSYLIKNSNISFAHSYDFLLTQEELLQKIGSNEKFIRKKRLLDK